MEVFFFTTTVSVTDQLWLISRRRCPFFNYPSLPNATQPGYGIINLIFFFKISVIWFLFRRKNNWCKFLVGVNFTRVKLLVEEKYWSPLKGCSLFTGFFLLIRYHFCPSITFLICHKDKEMLELPLQVLHFLAVR